MSEFKYQRVLIKLSGEAFLGSGAFVIDSNVVRHIAHQIKPLLNKGVQVAIVVGAGNIWRGSQAAQHGIDRVTGDYAGMLATVMNALALQDIFEKEGILTRTQSAIQVMQVAEPFIRRRAIRHLEKGRVVIFAAGTGNPYMTTDTAAALRAVEIEAQVLLMAKNKVDGVYDTDPRLNPRAIKYHKLTYLEAIKKRLKIMDATALSLCDENKLPIVVFDLMAENGIERACRGEDIGTIITGEETDR